MDIFIVTGVASLFEVVTVISKSFLLTLFSLGCDHIFLLFMLVIFDWMVDILNSECLNLVSL